MPVFPVADSVAICHVWNLIFTLSLVYFAGAVVVIVFAMVPIFLIDTHQALRRSTSGPPDKGRRRRAVGGGA